MTEYTYPTQRDRHTHSAPPIIDPNPDYPALDPRTYPSIGYSAAPIAPRPTGTHTAPATDGSGPRETCDVPGGPRTGSPCDGRRTNSPTRDGRERRTCVTDTLDQVSETYIFWPRAQPVRATGGSAPRDGGQQKNVTDRAFDTCVTGVQGVTPCLARETLIDPEEPDNAPPPPQWAPLHGETTAEIIETLDPYKLITIPVYVPKNSTLRHYRRTTCGTLDPDNPPLLIRIHGSSMRSDLYRDGATAIVNPVEHIENGAPVLVDLGGWYYIKYIKFDGIGGAELHNETDDLPVKRFTADDIAHRRACVIGRLVSVGSPIPLPTRMPQVPEA